MEIQQYHRAYSTGNGEMYIRYRSVVFVDVGEQFYQVQEYMA